MEESGRVVQNGTTIQLHRIQVDSADTQAILLRTPASGKRVRIFACALFSVGALDNAIYFRSGSSDAVFCSSANPYPLSTSPGYGYGGLVLNRNQDGWFEGAVDEDLYLVTTTDGPVQGTVILGDAPGS
jgi:hypothetical protein